MPTKNTFRSARKLKIGIGLLVLFSLFGGTVLAYIYLDRELDYCPEYEINDEILIRGPSSPISILLVGDSWVGGSVLNNMLQASLQRLGIDAEVTSFGISGAKSREIYRSLLQHRNQERLGFIEDGQDFLVVIAGVNDTQGLIGSTFYSHHIMCLVNAATEKAIFPVIVEMPEVADADVSKINFILRIKRIVYSFLSNESSDDLILEYRQNLKKHLDTIPDRMYALVPFNKVAEDYNLEKVLYADAFHLNKLGTLKLAEAIADSIAASVIAPR